MSENLWPDFTAEKMTSPKTLMIEQANYLSEKTGNVLVGKINTSTTGDDIYHSFMVIAPALGNYSFQLFYIKHQIIFYPLTLFYKGRGSEVANEHAMIQSMKNIFNDDFTKKMISTLYSQSISG